MSGGLRLEPAPVPAILRPMSRSLPNRPAGTPSVRLGFVTLSVLAAMALCSCSDQRSDMQTHYLAASVRRPPQEGSRAAMPPQAGQGRPSPPAHPEDSLPARNSEPLRSRRAQLVSRAEALALDDADSVCLRLQLIPRDEVFDRVNVKRRLVRYISNATTEEELSSIAYAIDHPRR